MGRPIKDGLPRKHMKTDETISINLENRQKTQEFYYNRNTHYKPPLSTGQPITYQAKAGSKWEPGTITKVSDSYPRSYHIKSRHGNEIRRNRNHLRPIPHNWSDKTDTMPPLTLTTAKHQEPPQSTSQVELPNSPVQEQAVAERPPVRGDTQSPQEHNNDVQTNNHYVTRSGRTVKSPQIYTC